MKNCLIVDRGSVTGLRTSNGDIIKFAGIPLDTFQRQGISFIKAFETDSVKAMEMVGVDIKTNIITNNKPKAEFIGYKGGFDSKGKGSIEGDSKDKAMREVANAAIVELRNDKPSSPKTTLDSLGSYNENDSSTVMLARNAELNGEALKEKTKQEIKKAHENGSAFVVGDTPGVDTQFIEYLIEIGAKFEVYHTANQSRINVENMITAFQETIDEVSFSKSKKLTKNEQNSDQENTEDDSNKTDEFQSKQESENDNDNIDDNTNDNINDNNDNLDYDDEKIDSYFESAPLKPEPTVEKIVLNKTEELPEIKIVLDKAEKSPVKSEFFAGKTQDSESNEPFVLPIIKETEKFTEKELESNEAEKEEINNKLNEKETLETKENNKKIDLTPLSFKGKNKYNPEARLINTIVKLELSKSTIIERNKLAKVGDLNKIVDEIQSFVLNKILGKGITSAQRTLYTISDVFRKIVNNVIKNIKALFSKSTLRNATFLTMIGSNLSLATKDGSTLDLYSMIKYAAIKYGVVELKADVVKESNDNSTLQISSQNSPIYVKKKNEIKDVSKEVIIPTGFQTIGKVRDNVSSNSTDSLLSYRNQWIADDGFVFFITSNRKNASDDKTRTWDNVEGVGHFIIDTDMSGKNATMYINPEGRPNEYFPVFIKDNTNEFAYKMIYKKGKDVDLKKDRVVTPLVQFKLSNINWNDSRKIYKSSKEFYTFDGKPTGFLFKDENAYGRFNGNSVVFIFEYKGKTVVRDFAGSISQIKKEAESIKSDYNLTADDIVIGRYDAGSFSAKPAAKKQKLDRNQWNSFNLNDGGSAMMIPSSTNQNSNKTNYSKFDTETNPTQDFKDLIQSLSDKLGIPVKYDNNLPYAGAFIDGNVVLNPSKMDETTVWHEFAHPFVQAVRRYNKPAYDSLINEIYNTPHGKALLKEVQSLYGEKNQKIQEEEVIVELIARYSTGKIDGFTAKKYKSIWTKVKDFINNIGKMIFNINSTDLAKTVSPLLAEKDSTISVFSLTEKTTIKDLSQILKFGGRILTSNQASYFNHEDYSKMIKESKPFSKTVEDLNGVFHNIGAYMTDADVNDTIDAIDLFIDLFSKDSKIELAAWHGKAGSFNHGKIKLSFKKDAHVKQYYTEDVLSFLMDTNEGKERLSKRTDSGVFGSSKNYNNNLYAEAIFVATKNNVSEIIIINELSEKEIQKIIELASITNAKIIPYYIEKQKEKITNELVNLNDIKYIEKLDNKHLELLNEISNIINKSDILVENNFKLLDKLKKMSNSDPEFKKYDLEFKNNRKKIDDYQLEKNIIYDNIKPFVEKQEALKNKYIAEKKIENAELETKLLNDLNRNLSILKEIEIGNKSLENESYQPEIYESRFGKKDIDKESPEAIYKEVEEVFIEMRLDDEKSLDYDRINSFDLFLNSVFENVNIENRILINNILLKDPKFETYTQNKFKFQLQQYKKSLEDETDVDKIEQYNTIIEILEAKELFETSDFNYKAQMQNIEEKAKKTIDKKIIKPFAKLSFLSFLGAYAITIITQSPEVATIGAAITTSSFAIAESLGQFKNKIFNFLSGKAKNKYQENFDNINANLYGLSSKKRIQEYIDLIDKRLEPYSKRLNDKIDSVNESVELEKKFLKMEIEMLEDKIKRFPDRNKKYTEEIEIKKYNVSKLIDEYLDAVHNDVEYLSKSFSEKEEANMIKLRGILKSLLSKGNLENIPEISMKNKYENLMDSLLKNYGNKKLNTSLIIEDMLDKVLSNKAVPGFITRYASRAGLMSEVNDFNKNLFKSELEKFINAYNVENLKSDSNKLDKLLSDYQFNQILDPLSFNNQFLLSDILLDSEYKALPENIKNKKDITNLKKEDLINILNEKDSLYESTVRKMLLELNEYEYLKNKSLKKESYQPEIYKSRFGKKDIDKESLKSILSDYGISYDSFSPQLKSEIETKLTNNPELLNDSNFIKSLTC